MNVACLPLHIWDRELDSRILLSMLLAEAGATVALGHEYNVSPIYTGASAVFHYGAGRPIFNKIRTNGWYREIIRRSGYVGLVFEEGINDILVDETSIENYAGINQESVEFLSRFYAWTEKDKSQILRACPILLQSQLEPKSICASHARIELLGALGRSYYMPRASAIEKLFGNYFLISDNFGLEVFGVGKGLDPTINAKDYSTDKSYLQSLKEKRASYVHMSRLVRDRFAAAINNIVADNPQTTFVFRPHPVADPTYWYSSLIKARNLIMGTSKFTRFASL